MKKVCKKFTACKFMVHCLDETSMQIAALKILATALGKNSNHHHRISSIIQNFIACGTYTIMKYAKAWSVYHPSSLHVLMQSTH